MGVIIITGSSGLIGSEAVEFFSSKFDTLIGIDNDLRKHFFGGEASTIWNLNRLKETIPNYVHLNEDIRNQKEIDKIFSKYSTNIDLIIHAAAQPSHDWAANDPIMDFTVNANGTLNLLEAFKKHCPNAVFIFTSTNKVYGDNPNYLPLEEQESRFELNKNHPYFENGIDEQLSIDNTKHSLFGASKTAADILVQEYGKYFGLNTGVFRGGCLTGPNHSGTQLHGFLSYLLKCTITNTPYTIFGYKGKQVRDNIHSFDLINMFWHYYQAPRQGEVYNAGGGRNSNCSMLEAINLCESVSGKKLQYSYSEQNRVGDHIWWISDLTKFKTHYPEWEQKYDLEMIIEEMNEQMTQRMIS